MLIITDLFKMDFGYSGRPYWPYWPPPPGGTADVTPGRFQAGATATTAGPHSFLSNHHTCRQYHWSLPALRPPVGHDHWLRQFLPLPLPPAGQDRQLTLTPGPVPHPESELGSQPEMASIHVLLRRYLACWVTSKCCALFCINQQLQFFVLTHTIIL